MRTIKTKIIIYNLWHASSILCVLFLVLITACSGSETEETVSDDASETPIERCTVGEARTMTQVCNNPDCTGTELCQDSTAPQVNVTSATIVDSADYTLHGNVIHDRDLANLTYNLNDAGEVSLSMNQDEFNVALTLQAGDNSIVLLAVDDSGNEGRFQTVIRFDSYSGDLHANFSTQGTFEVSEPIHFDATSTIVPHDQTAHFEWDFGDGSRAQGQQANHVYSKPDIYIVTLRVHTGEGEEAFHLDNIEVVSRDLRAALGRVSGIVVAPDGSPINAAQVTLNESHRQVISTTSGSFEFDTLPFDEPMTLFVSHPEFVASSLRFEVDGQLDETFLRLVMQPEPEAQTVDDAATDTTIIGDAGASTETSSGSLVDSDGNAVTGRFEIVITSLNVAQHAEQLPGSSTGILYDGRQTELQAAGAVHVAFYQNGQPLQVAPNRSISLAVPMYIPMVSEGGSIRAFTLSEASGLWIEQPEASVQSNPQSPPQTIASLNIQHAGWWLVAREASPNMTVSATCTLTADNDDDVDTNLDAETTDIAPETCWVEASAPGWSHNFGTPIDTTESFDAPAGEVCLRAMRRRGLCRGELCVTADRDDAVSADIVLTCLDEEARAINDQETIDDITLDPDTPMAQFSFIGHAGDGVIFQIRQQGRRELAGKIELFSSTGNILASEPFEQNQNQAVAAVLPDDGPYFATVTINNGESGDVSTKLLIRPVLHIGDTASGTIDTGESVTYLVDATDAELLNSILTGELGNNSNTTRFYWFDLLGARQPTASRALGIETGIIDTTGKRFHQIQLSRASVGGSSPINYEFVIATTARTPLPITFDALGRGIVTSQINTYGEHRFIEVNASAGDGLYVELRGAGDSPSESAHKLGLRIWYQGTGTPWNGEERLYTLTADPGVIGAMDAWQERAPYDGTYVFEVFPYSFSDSQIELGRFELAVDKVQASTDITVGDSDCAGATTRSYSAAMRAIQANGTVTICEGTFLSLTKGYISEPGVTLQGAGSDESILRYTQSVYRNDGQVALAISENNITIQDLGIVYRLPPEIRDDGYAIISDYRKRSSWGKSTGTRLSNLRLIVDTDHYWVAHGVHLIGESGVGTSDIEVSNVEINGVHTGIWIRGDDISVLNTTLRTRGIGVRIDGQNTMIGFIIEDSTINAGSDGIFISSAANVHIAANTILSQDKTIMLWLDRPGPSTSKIANNTMISSNAVTSVILTQQEQADSEPRIVRISNNYIGSSDRRISSGVLNITAYDSTTAFQIEQNHLDTNGGQGVKVYASNGRPAGSLAIINNIIQEAWKRDPAIEISGSELFNEIGIVNNSIRAERSSTWTEAHRAVRLGVDDRNFTGTMPVAIHNNIFRAPDDSAQHIGIELGTNSAVSIDSDYNLFFKYPNAYAGGMLTAGAHDIIDEDPLFANAQLEVEPISPAVDAGTCSGAPTTDFTGSNRPQGATCDIGAFEQ